MQGRIIKLISNQYKVMLENQELVDTIISGKMRLKMSPKAGDIVDLEIREGKYVIVNIHDRYNDLGRPPIANIDQMLIVMSAKRPDFSVSLVDQMLVMAHYHHIKPIIVVSKYDLLEDGDAIHQDIKDYQNAGYDLILSGNNYETSEIENLLEYKFSVLSGQSGVGKSTLLNRINPDFEIKTQDISEALGRGKHTTRHVEFMPIKNGWVADTPGFSKIDLTVLDKEELRDSMNEFLKYSEQCRFRDCFHINEPGCAVLKALKNGDIAQKRYDNYVKFYNEIDDKRKRYY